MDIKYSLFVAFLWSISQSLFACELTIAKIQWRPELANSVSVLRDGKIHFIEENNRELCRGDQIIVPKESVPVTIWYFSEFSNKEEIQSPITNYPLKELKEPCGMWCKAEDKIVALFEKLTAKKVLKENLIGVATRGNDENKSFILPLNAGKSKEIPFFLFPTQETITLFWQHGKPPFQITLQDESGKVLLEAQITEREWAFKPTSPEIGTTYQLAIKDQQNQMDTINIEFSVPPFPIDHKMEKLKLFTLLLRQEKSKENFKNWRLEIYRQLLTLPDTPEKQNFLDHLIADDF